MIGIRGTLRHRTKGAFRESVGADIETSVESRAVVLPGDRRSELHELLFAEVALQLVEQELVDIRGGPAESHRVAQCGLLGGRIGGALFEAVNVVQLLVGDSGFSAPGRIDVDSKRAAHDGRDLDGAKKLQGKRNRFRALLADFHERGGPEDAGMVGAHAHGRGRLAEHARGDGEEDAAEEPGVIGWRDARHGALLFRRTSRRWRGLGWRRCSRAPFLQLSQDLRRNPLRQPRRPLRSLTLRRG